MLQPEIATQLRDRKLNHINHTFENGPPDQIVSANIGCINHLQSGTKTPVRHWIELLDEALQTGGWGRRGAGIAYPGTGVIFSAIAAKTYGQ